MEVDWSALFIHKTLLLFMPMKIWWNAFGSVVIFSAGDDWTWAMEWLLVLEITGGILIVMLLLDPFGDIEQR